MTFYLHSEIEPRDSIDDPAYDGAVDQLLPMHFEDCGYLATLIASISRLPLQDRGLVA